MKNSITEQDYRLLSEIQASGGPIGANTLSLKLGISSATLGRRMQAMEYQGYIKKSGNRGRVLTKTGNQFLNELHMKIDSAKKTEELRVLTISAEKQDILDMLTVRRALEVESVSLACKNITPEQLQHLKNVIQQQDREKAENRVGDKQDLEFHLGIAKTSENRCIERLLTLLLLQDGNYVKLSIIAQVAKSLPYSISHHGIIQALERKDEELARDKITKHIEFYMQYVEKYL